MFRLSLLIVVAVGSVRSLRVEDADEGPCGGIPASPVPISDLRFTDRLTYMPAATRFNYYTVASGHPRFRQMRESDLVNGICLTHNIPLSKPVEQGALFGFGGRNLGNYTGRHLPGRPGLYHFSQDFDPSNPHKHLATKTQSITLTDYKTFAFFEICWNMDNTQHKSWVVFSQTPELSSSTKRKIEKHAASLGFNRRNFVFLNYDNCDSWRDQENRGGWSSGVSSG